MNAPNHHLDSEITLQNCAQLANNAKLFADTFKV